MLAGYKILIQNVYWQEIDLFGNKVKYNYGLGDINDIDHRSINHANTYAIEKTGNNITVLGLNLYNPTELAKRLNLKYKFRITNNGILEREGVLVVSSVKGDIINLNLFDNAVDLLDQWGNVSLHEVMLDPRLGNKLPADYAAAYTEISSYTVGGFDTILPVLQDITGANHPIASFPNTLNNIGEKFNINSDGLRYEDHLNVFQTRPQWNVKALLDIAAYQFGYDPEYSSNVDITTLENLFVVGDGSQRKSDETNKELTKSWDIRNLQDPYYTDTISLISYFVNDYTTGAVTPNSITGWTNPSGITETGYEALECIHEVENTEDEGIIAIEMEMQANAVAATVEAKAWGVWYNAGSTAPLFQELTVTQNTYRMQSGDTLIINFNKEELDPAPAGASSFLGVMSYIEVSRRDDFSTDFINSIATESFIESIGISYDTYNQYKAETVNLLSEAPDTNFSTVISGILRQQGILLEINDGKVKYFTYDDIKDKKAIKDWYDWSDYFVKVEEYDTNFGSGFGQVNLLSLKSPYRGNIYEKKISSEELSKFKPSATFEAKLFQDVTKATVTGSPNTTPANYYEFTSQKIGLVEQDGTVSDVIQSKYDTPNGAVTEVPYLLNVNYDNIPKGLDTWFNLISNSVQMAIVFLLPPDVIKNLDLTNPVFVKQLGSTFAINKIEEYEDGQTPVLAKMIRI